jgi:hypothetical protein
VRWTDRGGGCSPMNTRVYNAPCYQSCRLGVGYILLLVRYLPGPYMPLVGRWQGLCHRNPCVYNTQSGTIVISLTLPPPVWKTKPGGGEMPKFLSYISFFHLYDFLLPTFFLSFFLSKKLSFPIHSYPLMFSLLLTEFITH